jgi:hypothetical protein
MDSDFKLISGSHDVVLLRNKKIQTKFRLMFTIKTTKSLNVRDFLDFSVYKQLYDLNKDLIDDVIVKPIKTEEDTCYVVILLKKVGETMGITEKYLASKVKLITPSNGDCVGLVGTNATLDEIDIDLPAKYARLECIESNLFSFKSQDTITTQFDFNIEDPYFTSRQLQVPRAITDVSALLLKKAFIRMKEYKASQIESL